MTSYLNSTYEDPTVSFVSIVHTVLSCSYVIVSFEDRILEGRTQYVLYIENRTAPYLLRSHL
jgi:hypothetical protein